MSETESKNRGFIQKKDKGSGIYENLHLQGVKLLQDLSGANWTDYNEHDPGVTILENIAFTLTSLAYKTQFPIEDILTESKGSDLVSGDNGFFIPSEILTTSPVTSLDYRKLFIDGISNIKNVWIVPVGNSEKNIESNKPNGIKGLYEIQVQLHEMDEDTIKKEVEIKRVKAAVLELFRKNRNLCEELAEVTILEDLDLQIELKLTLESHTSGEEVLARIFYKINDHLSHEVKFYSLWEYEEENEKANKNSATGKERTINTIFNGPVLKNGFIPDHQLSERTQVIDPVQIINLIGKEPGVISVDKLKIVVIDTEGKTHYSTDGKPLILDITKQVPVLRVPETSETLIYTIDGIEFRPNIHLIENNLSYITAKEYGSFKAVSQQMNTIEIPEGTSRNLSDFFPMREQFPGTYGIGEYGLASNLPPQRYAQAKQLKAFLLPMEQCMQNFLAQLTNLYSLYDVKSEEARSYYYKPLADMMEISDLIHTHESSDVKEMEEIWDSILQSLNEKQDCKHLDRMHRLTNHLLTRFGESFYPKMLKNININAFGKEADNSMADLQLLNFKKKLIANYGSLSYNRFRGINYSETNNPTAFKAQPALIEKLAILMGIENRELRLVSEVIKDSGVRVVRSDTELETFQVVYEEEGEEIDIEGTVSIESPKDDLALGFRFPGNTETIFDDILRNGAKKENYQIKEVFRGNTKLYEVQFAKENKQVVVHRANTRKDAIKAVERATVKLQKLGTDSEALFLVEHLQLLPPLEEKNFGFSFSIRLERGKTISFEQATTETLVNRNKNLNLIFENETQLKVDHIQKGDAYIIRLGLESNKTLAYSTMEFADMDSVICEIEALRNLIDCGYFNLSVRKLKNFAYYGKNKVDEDFYSFQMSLVLPSWPARFQLSSFRSKFEGILLENSPAHIVSHCFWVDYPRLYQFEHTYFDWLKCGASNPEKSKLSFTLIRLLKEFRQSKTLRSS